MHNSGHGLEAIPERNREGKEEERGKEHQFDVNAPVLSQDF